MWATRLSFPSAGGAWPILCGFSPRVGIPDFEPPGILTWILPQSNGITFLQFKVRCACNEGRERPAPMRDSGV